MFVSILCILVSIFISSILFSYYRSVPYIKKNLLTRLDNLYVLNFTFFVCGQCFVCIFSLLCDKRNDVLYLAVFVIITGSLTIVFGITIVLSFCRVYIIMAVSTHYTFRLLGNLYCCSAWSKLNTEIGLHTHPPPPTTNFWTNCRQHKEVKFGMQAYFNPTRR